MKSNFSNNHFHASCICQLQHCFNATEIKVCNSKGSTLIEIILIVILLCGFISFPFILGICWILRQKKEEEEEEKQDAKLEEPVTGSTVENPPPIEWDFPFT